MRFQMIKPKGFLKEYVKYYCIMESESRDEVVVERVIPTESVQLMFHYRRPFVVRGTEREPLIQPRTIISGLSHSFSDVATDGDAGVIFVTFYPGRACHFMRFSLSEIENRSMDLGDVFNREIREIEEKLFHAETAESKIGLVEEFLINHFSAIPVYDQFLITRGIDLVKRYSPTMTAVELAEELCVTTKTLERKFAGYIGKTPKQFIRLMRFQKIIAGLTKNKESSLTDFAYQNGYYDQSHFIRDFKAYTGYTPKGFLTAYPDYSAEDFPDPAAQPSR
jgi:AraC-like DNA-binding protein